MEEEEEETLFPEGLSTQTCGLLDCTLKTLKTLPGSSLEVADTNPEIDLHHEVLGTLGDTAGDLLHPYLTPPAANSSLSQPTMTVQG